MKLSVVSGRSGSGKTITLNVLEDLGYYCVDNIPVVLLPELLESIGSHDKVAVSIDARNAPPDLREVKQFLDNFRQAGNICEILYLDADENTLLQRYSETRRRHPLTNPQVSLREAIRKELEVVGQIANFADLTVDTSRLSRHQLCQIIRDRSSDRALHSLCLMFQSFGFKRGIPPDADFVFDVRCLPNPYWSPDLRTHTGLDEPVRAFLSEQANVGEMIEDIKQYLINWIDRFEADNRAYLSIAIGCTGGQHRSVFIAESLAAFFKADRNNVQVRHRELLSNSVRG